MGKARITSADSYQKYICFVCGVKIPSLRGGFDTWLGIRFCRGECEHRVRMEMFARGQGRSRYRGKELVLRAIRARKRKPLPTRHELKCWPSYWNALAQWVKNFDIRKGEDRQYQVGDILVLREFDPKRKRYTGRRLERKIGYIMHGFPFLPSDVWVLGFVVEGR